MLTLCVKLYKYSCMHLCVHHSNEYKNHSQLQCCICRFLLTEKSPPGHQLSQKHVRFQQNRYFHLKERYFCVASPITNSAITLLWSCTAPTNLELKINLRKILHTTAEPRQLFLCSQATKRIKWCAVSHWHSHWYIIIVFHQWHLEQLAFWNKACIQWSIIKSNWIALHLLLGLCGLKSSVWKLYGH